MSLDLWPFLPSLGCGMWTVPIKAGSPIQGCLLAKTPSMQSITVSVCVYVFLYIYVLYIYINYRKKIKIEKSIFIHIHREKRICSYVLL